MTLCGGRGIGAFTGLSGVSVRNGGRGFEYGFGAEPQVRVRGTVMMVVAGLAIAVLMLMLMLLGGGDTHEITHIDDGLLALVELRLLGPTVVAGSVDHHDVGLGQLGQIGWRRLIIMRLHGGGINQGCDLRAFAAKLLGERTPLVDGGDHGERGAARIVGVADRGGRTVRCSGGVPAVFCIEERESADDESGNQGAHDERYDDGDDTLPADGIRARFRHGHGIGCICGRFGCRILRIFAFGLAEIVLGHALLFLSIPYI